MSEREAELWRMTAHSLLARVMREVGGKAGVMDGSRLVVPVLAGRGIEEVVFDTELLRDYGAPV